MADAEQTAASLQHLVGSVRSMTMHRIEAGAIAGFVEAVGEPENPGTSAAGTGGTDLVAPPTFLGTLRGNAEMNDIEFGSTTLNGGEEYEFLVPVRAGEVIGVVETVQGVRATRGRSGEMLIISTETEYRNADNVVVGRRRATAIKR